MAHEDVAFRAEVRNQVAQAERAHSLLEQVCTTLESEPAEEPYDAKAQRLRGAAVLAERAASELWVTVGWLEAAESATRLGLLPDGH